MNKEERKTELIQTRVTSKEYKKIAAICKKQETSISEWMRKKVKTAK